MILHITILMIICLTAIACALPGMFLVLRGVALLSDAISHSILLGIVAIFLLIGDLDSPLLFIGASLAGLLTVFCTEILITNNFLKKDAAISVVFPLFFSVGVILVSKYVRNVHLDVDMILLGEVALAPFHRLIYWGYDLGPRSVWLLSALIVTNAFLLYLFFKSLIFSLFDPDASFVAGSRPKSIYYILMFITSITAVAAFDIVGSVVVVALMITPAAAAYILVSSIEQYIQYTLILALMSGIGGYVIATAANVSIAGSVAVVCALLFLVLLVISPQKGLYARMRHTQKVRDALARTLLMEYMQENPHCSMQEVMRVFGWSKEYTLERVHAVSGKVINECSS